MPTMIEVTKIRPNPWQPRQVVDPAQLAELADSIRVNGLLQPPMARAVNGSYELVFGHRRFEAWKQARLGAAFPVEVVTLSDQQMAERAAAENGQREDLNPIDRARGIKRLLEEFKLTQADAGKFYGLASQGAVSNVLRLLKLTPSIQAMLSQGKITERQARGLIFMSTVDPKAADEIAADGLKDDDWDQGTQSDITDWFRKRGENLNRADWDLNWIPGLTVTVNKAPWQVPACSGCEFFWKGKYEKFCARRECFRAKSLIHAEAACEKASKRLGIPVVPTGGLTATLFYKGQWDLSDLVDRLLKNKPAHLRLMPVATGGQGWALRQGFGSEHVGLGSVDPEFVNGLKDAQEALRKKALVRNGGGKTAADYERERKEMAQREKVVAAMVDAVVPTVAAALPISDPLVTVLLDLASEDYEIAQATHKAKSVTERRHILALACVKAATFQDDDDPDGARDVIVALAKRLKLKLPANWDAAMKELPAPEPKKPAAKKKPAKKGK